MPIAFKFLLERHLNVLAGVQFLVPAKVHGLIEERHNVRIEGLPVIRVSNAGRREVCWELASRDFQDGTSGSAGGLACVG